MNRTVLITGASSGIGEATALALSEHFRIALVARRKDQLIELALKIRGRGGDALAVPDDITAPGAPERAVAQAVAHFGQLDALVNNAGMFETAAVEAITPEHVDRQLALNLRAPMLMVRAALPELRKRPGGWIVNVSSMAADASFATCSVYTATKAGLEAYSRVLREELRAANIRVGVVAPGATDTAAWLEGARSENAQRMCRPEDVAQAIRFVLEAPPSASYDRVVVAPPRGPL
jgi:NAD(P)-dependent dehydrogenase (short-subunit alcohol dehydrogenase family)